MSIFSFNDMKKFLKTVILNLSILCLITGIVDGIYLYMEDKNNYGTMQNCKNDNAVIREVPDNISICNFGSSHGYYGFDYEDVEGEVTCFNFGLPSQSLSYDYRILENYQDNIEEGASVFIVVSYFSLFGASETDSDQFLGKNKRYYKFLTNDLIKEYDKKTDFYVNYFPALIEGDIVRLAKKLIGINKDVWNMETDKKAAEDHGYRRADSHIKAHLDDKGNRIYNLEEIKALYDIIDFCQKKNLTPVLLTTPYLSEYNLEIQRLDYNFYDDFHVLINKVVSDTGVQYYDYSKDTRFTNDYSLFFNTDHLNRLGAKKLTGVLLDEITFSN